MGTDSIGTRRLAAGGAFLLVYALVRAFWWFDAQDQSGLTSYTLAAGLFKIVAWVVPSVLAALLLCRGDLRDARTFLGFDNGMGRGLLFGVIATLPLALAAASNPARVDLDMVVATAFVGPYAEEVLFRGFLLRTLHGYARWPAAWAVGAGALAFGAAHLPDVDLKLLGNLYIITARGGVDGQMALGRLASLVGTVATMSAGGLLFGWVAYRTGSLWPAIGLHGAMNLWLTVAAGEERAAAGMFSDAIGLAQVASIALALVLTFRRRPLATSPSPVRLS